jgi:hypothetical protein
MGTRRPAKEIGKKILLIYSSSVSIRFANGTVSDVAVVHGTEAYIRAMKRWQHLDTVPITLENKHK